MATAEVDVVGNLLVILSVLRNRKPRNAGESHARSWGRTLSGLVWTLTPRSAGQSLLSPVCRVPFSLT